MHIIRISVFFFELSLKKKITENFQKNNNFYIKKTCMQSNFWAYINTIFQDAKDMHNNNNIINRTKIKKNTKKSFFF